MFESLNAQVRPGQERTAAPRRNRRVRAEPRPPSAYSPPHALGARSAAHRGVCARRSELLEVEGMAHSLDDDHCPVIVGCMLALFDRAEAAVLPPTPAAEHARL
eukprot:SAG11_NODE_3347_length_2507_cov_1.937733_1_plen_104_part_00